MRIQPSKLSVNLQVVKTKRKEREREREKEKYSKDLPVKSDTNRPAMPCHLEGRIFLVTWFGVRAFILGTGCEMFHGSVEKCLSSVIKSEFQGSNPIFMLGTIQLDIFFVKIYGSNWR